MASIDLDHLNRCPADEFAGRLGGIFEHAPWVAAAVAPRRPFRTLADLFAALRDTVIGSDEARRLELLRGHPELAGAAAKSGNMTAESVAEQGGAGLDELSAERARAFDELNGRYRERFGFPFIICVRRHGRESVLSEFRRRVALSPEAEREAALGEVFRIAALRLDGLVEAPDVLPVHGRLSTHVLDTANGVPARGVPVELVELSAGGARIVAATSTNAAGRTDEPLVGGRPVPIGTYELRFHLGAYFRERGMSLPAPAFLDVVPLRFGIADPEAHWHVPLAATPWSYSTYRGS